MVISVNIDDSIRPAVEEIINKAKQRKKLSEIILVIMNKSGITKRSDLARELNISKGEVTKLLDNKRITPGDKLLIMLSQLSNWEYTYERLRYASNPEYKMAEDLSKLGIDKFTVDALLTDNKFRSFYY